MAKAAIDEVEVLRFFEEETLDRASLLFNIVADKMRARRAVENTEPTSAGVIKRRAKSIASAQPAENTPTE